MTDRNLPFQPSMVQALLAGRKTQTRRALRPQPLGIGDITKLFETGDRVWVREAWRVWSSHDNLPPRDISPTSTVTYEADPHVEDSDVGRYRAARYMPRCFSRLTLIVTDVRVERLQDISTRDALAEGVEMETADPPFYYVPGVWPHRITAVGVEEGGDVPHAVRSYSKLWNHINGVGAWEANPWVAAYTFTVHQCNIDQLTEEREV